MSLVWPQVFTINHLQVIQLGDAMAVSRETNFDEPRRLRTTNLPHGDLQLYSNYYKQHIAAVLLISPTHCTVCLTTTIPMHLILRLNLNISTVHFFLPTNVSTLGKKANWSQAAKYITKVRRGRTISRSHQYNITTTTGWTVLTETETINSTPTMWRTNL